MRPSIESLAARMAAFPDTLEGLAGSLADEDACWRPPGDGWSVREILGHLVDEEREDFRVRLARTLEDPEAPWTAIDPQGWVLARAHQERSVSEHLASFRAERAASVAWLRGLSGVDWRLAHAHPRLGTLRAGDLLRSWAAHDALHLRQLAARLFQLAERDAVGFSADYAGPW